MMERLRVAFVDDEPNVLTALRRSMVAMADEWEITFCGSGREVLDLMSIQPFDVIVSDMRMPNMDGAQLLNHVRQKYPGTVRIILSGYTDTEAILSSLEASHSYLAKPCSATEVRKVIGRQIGLRHLLNDPGLQNFIGGLSELPSPPGIYLKLSAEMNSPSSSLKSVADIIARDMAMTTEILKLTNSAYFTVNGNVSTPLQATHILGINVIRSLVLRIGLFRQFAGNPTVAPMIERLSAHGLVVAGIAQAIAVAEKAGAAVGEAAYCAGLLADIGCLVLLDKREKDYLRLLSSVGADNPLEVAEQNAFGANHTTLGAYLLGLWGFPDAVVEAVAYSVCPGACSGRDNLALTAVHAARALGPQLSFAPFGSHGVIFLDGDYLAQAGCAQKVSAWNALALTISALK